MRYRIKTLLYPDCIDILTSIKKNRLRNIIVDDIGEFALSIILDFTDKQIILMNTPVIQSDGDEYPCFTIKKFIHGIEGNKHILVNKDIENISIISDKVGWQFNGNEWLVESDIAIRISFVESEILLIAHDSLAGFIRIVETDGIMSNNYNMLNEYWSMKADVLSFLERQEYKL